MEALNVMSRLGPSGKSIDPIIFRNRRDMVALNCGHVIDQQVSESEFRIFMYSQIYIYDPAAVGR